jgi:hypothetical protein
MDNGEIITALGVAVPAILLALATLITVVMKTRNEIRLANQEARARESVIVAKVEEMAQHTATVVTHTNDMKDALVKATGGEQHALGKAEGVEQERSRPVSGGPSNERT